MSLLQSPLWEFIPLILDKYKNIKQDANYYIPKISMRQASGHLSNGSFRISAWMLPQRLRAPQAKDKVPIGEWSSSSKKKLSEKIYRVKLLNQEELYTSATKSFFSHFKWTVLCVSKKFRFSIILFSIL